MAQFLQLDHINISVKSHKLLNQLLKENKNLAKIIQNAKTETDALNNLKIWIIEELKSNQDAFNFYKNIEKGRKAYKKLEWKDYAAIRILDYIDNAGKKYKDLNLKGHNAISDPIKLIWLAVKYGTGGAKPDFFEDMLFLFRQFKGTFKRKLPSKTKVINWMKKHPSGLNTGIIKIREDNKKRIIHILIKKIDNGEIKDSKYFFQNNITAKQKYQQMLNWWNEYLFHLRFAIRSPILLNELLDNSLDPDTMKILYKAEKEGIPFFVNPYYLSLLNVHVPDFAIGADLTIRQYVIYSNQLVEEFGEIHAWEKEDEVEPGKPNAAGWILPTHHNVHRRYPEVAILIPATMGRACGGLCASCQRMYEFQRGNLNFNLGKLKPNETWDKRLKKIMSYWENDSQLRDILITGGDAFMSTNKSLNKILNAVYEMAIQKRQANKKRKKGEKFAEILRVRLGTRIPVYLPQRINNELCDVLTSFRQKALKIGVKQFIIQTHFESPLEITPEVKKSIKMLISTGWIVINQHVFTAAASRRGHNNKLRQVLENIGILPYYTFTVKGYFENKSNFATNARAIQEEIEEKIIGKLSVENMNNLESLIQKPKKIIENIKMLKNQLNIPFLATDRNVLNLPGVGKSLSFRVIGITRYGRRILEFEHDHTRKHSPIINKMGKVIIIESKSISEYLNQLDELGENKEEYKYIWGYSIGETEKRAPIYEYPDYKFSITNKLTNIKIE